MPLSHLFLALLVVIIWGINFLFVSLALEEMSPLLLCALRFLLASIPAIFFIKPPAVSFKVVALYGLVMFGLQFSLLFIGMNLGMTSGMASLIMQTQVFFSMFFATFFLNEETTIWQLIGALIAFIGIGVIAFHFDHDISIGGFLCILAAAATWGLGTLITKKNDKSNMVALVVWGSFISCPPMILLSLIIDGPDQIAASLSHLSGLGLLSLLYIVYLSTLVGYVVWNWLLSRYPVGTVVPFTLLVPIIGVLSSVLFLNEPLQSWKLTAGLLVMIGLFINLFGARFLVKKILPQEA